MLRSLTTPDAGVFQVIAEAFFIHQHFNPKDVPRYTDWVCKDLGDGFYGLHKWVINEARVCLTCRAHDNGHHGITLALETGDLILIYPLEGQWEDQRVVALVTFFDTLESDLLEIPLQSAPKPSAWISQNLKAITGRSRLDPWKFWNVADAFDSAFKTLTEHCIKMRNLKCVT